MALRNLTCEKDPLSTCRFRVLIAIMGFMFVYLVIALRLFDVCLSGNLGRSRNIEEAMHLEVMPENPIKRADIVDRNGTIIATSLPTVNLFANPKKMLNPQKAAVELARILPDLRYEDILAKLKRRGSFVYIKRNLTPSQQYHLKTAKNAFIRTKTCLPMLSAIPTSTTPEYRALNASLTSV